MTPVSNHMFLERFEGCIKQYAIVIDSKNTDKDMISSPYSYVKETKPFSTVYSEINFMNLWKIYCETIHNCSGIFKRMRQSMI